MTILDKLKEKDFDTVPASFYEKIGEWESWYSGNVKQFHNYTVFNGQSHVQCRRYSMGMGKKVCEDWANLLLNEKVAITLEGNKEQSFVDDVFRSNNFRVKANEMQEIKAALGTSAYVLRVDGATVRAEDGALLDGSKATIKIDYVSSGNIFPLSWENGIVSECAFASEKTVGGEKYAYLQIHRKDQNGQYLIENYIFENTNGQLTEVPLSSVKGFEVVPAVIYTGSSDPQFVIDRLNFVNNLDYTLPMGVSVFANAIDPLKGVDIAYDAYVNELVLGKKRIIVKAEAEKRLDGNPVFDPNDTVYYVLPEDVQDGSIIDPIDMTLRTQELNASLQDMLNVLSSKCGFGENHYKYDNGNISTATQVISENSTLFRTIKKHEIILEDVLKRLCRLILGMGNRYLGMGLNEEVEISIDFDDSIIEDKAVEFSRDSQMVSMGVMNDWEFRAKWMNEDPETAKAALPRMEAMVTEEQEETE